MTQDSLLMQELLHRTDSLSQSLQTVQYSFDSLSAKQEVAQLIYQSNQHQGVISDVNSLYDSMWGTALLFMTVSFALVGVVVPLVVYWMQKRSFKKRLKSEVDKAKVEFDKKLIDIQKANRKERAKLEKNSNEERTKQKEQYQKELNSLKSESQKSLEQQRKNHEERMERMEKTNELASIESKGILHYLQGRVFLLDKKWKDACVDFAQSVYYSVQLEDKYNWVDALVTNLDFSLSKLDSSESYDEVDNELRETREMGVMEIVEYVEQNQPSSEEFEESMKSLKEEIESCKKRVKKGKKK